MVCSLTATSPSRNDEEGQYLGQPDDDRNPTEHNRKASQLGPTTRNDHRCAATEDCEWATEKSSKNRHRDHRESRVLVARIVRERQRQDHKEERRQQRNPDSDGSKQGRSLHFFSSMMSGLHRQRYVSLAVSLTRNQGPVQPVTQKADARIRGGDRW